MNKNMNCKKVTSQLDFQFVRDGIIRAGGREQGEKACYFKAQCCWPLEAQ